MDYGAHQIFSGKEDNYGGVVVNLIETEPMTAQEFESKLDVSLTAWKVQGMRGIWIKLSSQLSSLVDSAIKRGFTYHHAENEYVSHLALFLPINASHRIGIGAFVLNKSREVLVVQEIGGRFKGTGVWKLPTGIIQEGEDIWTGAVSEVEEETGIKTKFVEVLAFRERHQSFFERKSSIFSLCELEASNFEIKKQDSEILDAKWMPIEEYVNQPINQTKEMFRFMSNICLKRSQEKENYAGFSTVLTKNSAGKESYLYCSVDHCRPPQRKV
uniref:Nudix hydrolase n=1 Tax=Brassica oleracea TaxID=3712 RepID=A0A3P6ASI7_BRAOL|nr:unnamed protein product [Brassica oleracea]